MHDTRHWHGHVAHAAEGLSDGCTAGVFLCNTGVKQLLMDLREKSLQERQQALFRISRQRYYKTVNCCLHNYAGISEGKESCSSTNTTID